MHRREVLKRLAFSSALPAIPADVLPAFREIHAGLSGTPALKAFTPHRDATATTMADLIIPARETPGAKAVRVNAFIDHIVAEWFSEKKTDPLSGWSRRR